MPDYDVTWNGSRHHPGGRQLFVEEEERRAARMQPYRSIAAMSPEERTALFYDARALGIMAAALKYHVNSGSLEYQLRHGMQQGQA